VKTLHGNYELTAGGVSVELSYVNGCFGPVKTDSGFVIQNHYSHIHDCIEIYINLSGRVSFIVNNLIFPVCRGDMIITSPGEYHRCVVHEYPHEHMCLWIRDKGESPLLAKLKNKKYNHVAFDDREEAERTTKLCEKLCDAFRNPAVSDAEKTMLFSSLLVTAAETEADPFAELNLPEDIDFNGYEFVYLMTDCSGSPVQPILDPFSVELSGEIYNDLVYNTLREVENKLNVVFKSNHSAYKDSTDSQSIRNLISANDTSFDLFYLVERFSAALAMEGMLIPYSSIDSIQLDRPWWDKFGNETVSINGFNYFEQSNFKIPISLAQVLYFNKNHFTDHRFPSPYDDVRNKSWTMDKLYNYMIEFTSDVNSDGKFTEEDNLGVIFSPNMWYNNFGPANGEYVIVKDGGGLKLNVLGNERLSAIWDKILTYEDGWKGYISTWEYGDLQKVFKNGSSLFMPGQVFVASQIRAMEDEFGIIPFPLFEEGGNNDKYTAYTSGFMSDAIPITATDPIRTGYIMDTLAYVFYKEALPVYIDMIVTNKNVCDTDSAEMLTMLSDNVYRDLAIGYIFEAGSLVYDTV
jgi:hypothetical protein